MSMLLVNSSTNTVWSYEKYYIQQTFFTVLIIRISDWLSFQNYYCLRVVFDWKSSH